MVPDSVSNDEHLFSHGTWLAHLRPGEMCFELFDLAFGCAGANGITLLVECLSSTAFDV